jgi:uncharacterized membrane protein
LLLNLLLFSYQTVELLNLLIRLLPHHSFYLVFLFFFLLRLLWEGLTAVMGFASDGYTGARHATV